MAELVTLAKPDVADAVSHHACGAQARKKARTPEACEPAKTEKQNAKKGTGANRSGPLSLS
jgi:hypothetical protein